MVFRCFGRCSPQRFHCQCGQLRYRCHTEAESRSSSAGIGRSATKNSILRVEEVLAADCVGRRSGRQEAASIRTYEHAGIVSTLGDWFINTPCFIRYTTTLLIFKLAQLISPATFIGKHDRQLKYDIPVAAIDSYKFSSIRHWNQLPSSAVFTASPATFQAITSPAVVEMKLPIGSKML